MKKLSIVILSGVLAWALADEPAKGQPAGYSCAGPVAGCANGNNTCINESGTCSGFNGVDVPFDGYKSITMMNNFCSSGTATCTPMRLEACDTWFYRRKDSNPCGGALICIGIAYTGNGCTPGG